ncbi:hypothetical protein H0H93_000523 [Arthromyces matolae]|nr:hypothetical protein H0H93_000523 [Arthromyces matolae]
MSVVSSFISSRTPVFRINVQASTLMDHIFAIVAGLGVRVVVHVVSNEDHKFTGSLVGLWEGVVVQHFVKKAPKSFDPYIAFAVRVFIDFLFTESLIRLVLTLLWTGMGIVLADIAPRVWADTGMRRYWRHLRRDLYIISQSVPTVPYFTRPRLVRFSPSQAPSVITSLPPSPSIVTINTQAPTPPIIHKRPVPGSYPDYVSETDTDLSIRSPALNYSTLHNRRPTVQTESELSYDPDEGNRSSSGSETPTPMMSEADLPNLPNIDDEDLAREVVLEEKDETTPKALPVLLPPTPSETAYAVHLHTDDVHEVAPPTAVLPQIPDDEDWENISRREAQPTPPPELNSESDRAALPVEPVSASTQEAVSALEAEPISDSAQHPEVSETEPPADQTHNPTDGAATASAEEIPSDKKMDDFQLLDDFNPGPLTKGNDSRPPSYAQFDLWSTNLGATSSGGNQDIWGASTTTHADVGGKEHNGVSDPWDQPTNKLGDESERNNINDQEDSMTEAVPLITDTANEPSTSAEQTEPQPAATQDEANEQDPSSQTIEQDPSPSSQVVSGEPSPTPPEPENATDGNIPASSAPLAELESQTQDPPLNPPPVDDEPFPEKNNDRLNKAFELRKQLVSIEKDIEKARRDLVIWGGSDTARNTANATVREKEGKREALSAKAKRWYADGAHLMTVADKDEDEDPPTEVDLSTLPGPQFNAEAQLVLIRCLLRNIQKLTIVVGPVNGARTGKPRKAALVKLLEQLSLSNRTYQVGQKDIDIHLP